MSNDIYQHRFFFKPIYNKQWIILGKFYGYPNCCIKEFCSNGRDRSNNQKKIMIKGYGFVPCKNCADVLIQKFPLNYSTKIHTLLIGRKTKYNIYKKITIPQSLYPIHINNILNNYSYLYEQFLKEIGYY